MNRGSTVQSKNLETTCQTLLGLCETGMPLRRLSECAEVTDEGTLSISSRELLLRTGPYSYYARDGKTEPFDDFAYCGNRLLVSAMGAVSTGKGKLVVYQARGKFSSSDLFHIVTPAPQDVSYLHYMLANSTAGHLMTGTNAARTIPLANLRGMPTPWPSSEYRDLFCNAVDACKATGQSALYEQLISSWMNAVRRIEHLEKPSSNRQISTSTHVQTEDDEGVFDIADGLIEVMQPVKKPSTAQSDISMVDVVSSTPRLERFTAMEKSDLCICFPPPNQRDWATAPVSKSDPRWVLGTPPRNKANYAWIQQTIACMADSGRSLLLLCNGALHSKLGCEKTLRENLAKSGLVEAVIALPGKLFADGRPPSSFVILGKDRHHREVLFIDALEKGHEEGKYLSGSIARRLDKGEAHKIVDTFASWNEGLNYHDISNYCRAVSISEIETNDCLLTPWTYVRSQDQAC